MSDTASSDHMSWLTNFFGGGGDSGSSPPPAAAAAPPPSSSPSFLSEAASLVSSACGSVTSAVQEKTGYSVTQIAKAVTAPIVALPTLGYEAGEAVGANIMGWKSEHDQAEATDKKERALSQQIRQEHEQAEADKKAMQEGAERDARDEGRERARRQAEDEKTLLLIREKRAQEEEVARLQQDREEKARKAMQEQGDEMRARLQPVGFN